MSGRGGGRGAASHHAGVRRQTAHSTAANVDHSD
eukprot:CAMPEP_0204237654 /NCGR_PEP_ID=MMETSP0361-20130328/93424_1 /ASSEMBLY_ACC=CAM_ASM_000343 /TAXON_ID=268821 /ORGANISM="Scrippsiella Hangoei, Strain SHTV-5" /LENGTH=33 /DNA_ID= /DNA_START= /DNA_END= /DNA_ORIENTATION=